MDPPVLEGRPSAGPSKGFFALTQIAGGCRLYGCNLLPWGKLHKRSLRQRDRAGVNA